MTYHAYLFEAKSIQSYILATNCLKEIVGASELIESLTGTILNDVINRAGSGLEFSRQGGGAMHLFSTNRQSIERIAVLWPLVVRQYAPDLEFVQAQGQGDSAYAAYQQAHQQLHNARNIPQARIPQAPPPAERSRRTGEPAVAWYKKTRKLDPNVDPQGEPVDAATLRKLDNKFWRGTALCNRFAPTSSRTDWPLNLTPKAGEEDDERNFPFLAEDYNIAIIHTNGNDLGQLLIKLSAVAQQRREQYILLFRKFSEAITAATQKAAQLATEAVLKPHRTQGVYPARPIVLGGDDLTILVRADLALDFTRHFLMAFAEQSHVQLKTLKQQLKLPDLPDRFTACAGIVYAKASQPLHLLHELAKNLCKHAKKCSKAQNKDNIPTSLSFHRVTTYFVDNYSDILKHELTFGNLQHTLECYALEPEQGLPLLDDLLHLHTLFTTLNLSYSTTRELLGIISTNVNQAPRRYQRWREIMQERNSKQLAQFDKLLLALGITPASADLPYTGTQKSNLRRSPLGDVIMLTAAGDTCQPNGQPTVTIEN
ncbi:hypothetical protein TI04_00705 [Achromatium sp. WMS2]|nr:hypothetical protein TI04_00705 [Achromatium sp. WMS2]